MPLSGEIGSEQSLATFELFALLYLGYHIETTNIDRLTDETNVLQTQSLQTMLKVVNTFQVVFNC